MENQNPRVPILWEHSLTNLLGHDSTSDPGIALRQWVHFQGVHNILDLLSWDQEELKAVPAQQVYSLDDHGQGLYLRTNQIKEICGLITYETCVWGLQLRHRPKGCDRILTYGTLLDVLCIPGSPMGRSEGLSRRWTG